MRNRILLSAFILLFLNSGCTQRTEYEIAPGPSLETYKVEKQEFPPLKIKYEVR